jgi:hypothetical protein
LQKQATIMKRVILLSATALFLASCGNQNSEQPSEEPTQDTSNADEMVEAAPKMVGDYTVYGEEITAEGALSPEEFLAALTEVDTLRAKMKSSVNAACKKKGCWMKVDMADANDMRVRFKDYGFFVPLDSEGSEAIIEGIAYKDTVAVDELRHYAEDAGKTEEEIAAITEPEINVSFLAKGVLLK